MNKKQKIAAFVGLCAIAGLYLYFNKKKEESNTETIIDSQGNEQIVYTNVKAGQGKG